jgi:hypothetical protein
MASLNRGENEKPMPQIGKKGRTGPKKRTVSTGPFLKGGFCILAPCKKGFLEKGRF